MTGSPHITLRLSVANREPKYDIKEFHQYHILVVSFKTKGGTFVNPKRFRGSSVLLSYFIRMFRFTDYLQVTAKNLKVHLTVWHNLGKLRNPYNFPWVSNSIIQNRDMFEKNSHLGHIFDRSNRWILGVALIVPS